MSPAIQTRESDLLSRVIAATPSLQEYRSAVFFHRSLRAIAEAGCIALLVFATGCASSSSKNYQPYSPHENLLSIATEFQLLASQDPYRDGAPKDLTGQSIARSTLVRLANYESLHPGKYSPELLTLKARTLELLGEYESARRNFAEAAEADTELRADDLHRAENLDLLIAALSQPRDATDLPQALAQLQSQAADFRTLAKNFKEPLYQSLAFREAEDAEVRRAELMASNRYALADGEAQAQQALEALTENHKTSSRALEHAMRLAHYHRDIAEQEVRLNPPERGGFSAERFKTHYDAAVDILHRVSEEDGKPERLIAKHELDGMLAMGEVVRERMK
ncbi:hypothetical protein BH09SUM1_BH09SUM1_23850 [soil metagenome]